MNINSETLIKVQALKDQILRDYDSIYRPEISVLDLFKNYGFYDFSLQGYMQSLLSLNEFMVYNKNSIIYACNAILKNRLYKFNKITLSDTIIILLNSDDIESFNLGKNLLPKNCYVKIKYQVTLVSINHFGINDIFLNFYIKERV